jgi:polyvinyl alcohol dehydrogenase (cytochrome)
MATDTFAVRAEGSSRAILVQLLVALASTATACSSSGASHATGGGSAAKGGPDSGAPDAAPVFEATVPAVPQPDCSADSQDWPMFGHNVCNTGSSFAGQNINKDNVGKLKTKWVYQAAGEVSATPAVVGGSVYEPDWGGSITRLDVATGNVVWTKSVGVLVGANAPGAVTSRTTPLVVGQNVIIGTNGAQLVAFDKDSGATQWKATLGEYAASTITGSPGFDGNRIYVGIASGQEAYSCCTFRGSVVAVDASTGNVVWRTHTIRDDVYYADDAGTVSGYAGAAVWSSTPVIDRKRKQLYVTTGNDYGAPAGAPGTMDGNYVDSVIALDMDTGAVRWARSVPEGGRDVWTFGNPDSPDSDFGSGANLFTAMINGTPTDLVGAGQKSGVYWALDPATGAVVWKTQVGPSGHLGGIHWGTAIDGTRIYAGVNNEGAMPFVLGGKGAHAGETVQTGAWAALDPASGDILWQIANPAMQYPLHGASVNGPVVAVNGVLFGGSMDADGTMFAFDAATGNVLWSFKSGGTVYGGPAVAGGIVYWGSGYPTRLGFGTSSRKLYAFQVSP